MHRAVVDVPCGPEEGKAVTGALAVEAVEAPPGTSVQVTWSETDAGLCIEIEADGLSGLRAALQGTMRLVDASLRVVRGRP